MNKVIYNICLLVISALFMYAGIYYFDQQIYRFGGMFLSGLLFGIFLMNLKLNVKNNKLNSYKRELEKESISSDEASAKVKVLESKIEVLEKALENALGK